MIVSLIVNFIPAREKNTISARLGRETIQKEIQHALLNQLFSSTTNGADTATSEAHLFLVTTTILFGMKM